MNGNDFELMEKQEYLQRNIKNQMDILELKHTISEIKKFTTQAQ